MVAPARSSDGAPSVTDPPIEQPAPLIRRVVASEWPALRTLRLQSLRTDPQAFGATLAEEEAMADARWVDRARRGATSPDSGQWVAVDAAGGLVGCSVLAEVEGQVHVFAIWVAPDHRGRGLGGRLLDAALAWGAHAFPGRTFQLEVNPRQVAAVRLYESRGFAPTGGRRSLGHADGAWRIEMTRPPIS